VSSAVNKRNPRAVARSCRTGAHRRGGWGSSLTRACITERGLDQKVLVYRHKITEAMSELGASYKIDLRIVNNPVEAGYEASVGDVFTEVVRNGEMRDESFVITNARTAQPAVCPPPMYKIMYKSLKAE